MPSENVFFYFGVIVYIIIAVVGTLNILGGNGKGRIKRAPFAGNNGMGKWIAFGIFFAGMVFLIIYALNQYYRY